MTRFLAILVLLLTALPFAQAVKAFSVQASSSCQVSITGALDIENPTPIGYGRYYAYKDGCTAKIVDLSTKQTVYQLDLKSAGVNVTSVYATVNFYRNMSSSDGSWDAVYQDMTVTTSGSYPYTVGLLTGGNLQILTETATAPITLNLDDTNLYVIVSEQDRKDIYIVRNNVKISENQQLNNGTEGIRTTFSITPRTRKILWEDYNVAGQRITDNMIPQTIKVLRKH